MGIDTGIAIERVLEQGDVWQAWRASHLEDPDPAGMPEIPYQDELGGFLGPTNQPSPGSTGEALCHLKVIGLADSAAATIAADWLLEMRTPAMAWLDRPDDVPGELDSAGGARVWATAAAAAGLLSIGIDPGPRVFDLLRGEADTDGRFTGGAYPTFAAAAAYWINDGAESEMAEWALRWARDLDEQLWEPWELATGLTFWLAAGVSPDHPTVSVFFDTLVEGSAPEGFPDDIGLTMRTIELAALVT
jgi:hypothetical protein